MTNSRQRDDRTVEARARRRVGVALAFIALASGGFFVAQAIGRSAAQLRTALESLPNPVRENALPAVAPHGRERAAQTPLPAPPFPVPVTVELSAELTSSPAGEDVYEPAIAGPPSAADFLALVESGLATGDEADAEAIAALRQALEAPPEE